MKRKSSIKLNLTDTERQYLRRNRIKIAEIGNYAIDELEEILQVPRQRAKELYALADFQRIPSIGIRFAEDLVFMGYYSVEELQDKDGAALRDAYEQKKGYRIDSCVEDQFRLAVYFRPNAGYEQKLVGLYSQNEKNTVTEYGYPYRSTYSRMA